MSTEKEFFSHLSHKTLKDGTIRIILTPDKKTIKDLQSRAVPPECYGDIRKHSPLKCPWCPFGIDCYQGKPWEKVS